MKWRIALVMVFMLLVSVLAACGSSGTGGGDGTGVTDMPTLDGATLLEARCEGVCHDLERVDAASYSFEQWLPVLDKMIGKGAKLTPEEKTVLADFLATK